MRNILPLIAAALILCPACTKYDNSIPSWPWADPDEDPVWVDVSSQYKALPDYIKIFKSPSRIYTKAAKAYVAKIDMSKAEARLWALNDPANAGTTEALRTPAKVYEKEGNPAIVINGGYFWPDKDTGKNYTYSLAIDRGTLLSTNLIFEYETERPSQHYYPTRAVFLMGKDKKFQAAWSYYVDANHHYVYQTPAQNSFESKPLQVPSATFPSEGALIDAEFGIGGGPVLLKNGTVMNTYRQELFYGNSPGNKMCPDSHPRTAIGATAEGELMLFVCEGREMTPGVQGFTTEEVAKILKALGCVDAMNLDGGGSSEMLVCGYETIKPSDGAERPVGSCIYIK